jgi:transposase
LRQSDGSLLEERKYPTRKLPELVRRLEKSRIVMETCSEAFKVAEAAKAAGHEIRIVPATLVRTLGVGARGIKTDQRDARTLSEVSCRIDLPSVHLPSERSRELKTICGSRDALIETRTKLINNVRGWLRTQLLRLRSGKASSFADRVRSHGTPPIHIERTLIAIEALCSQIKDADKQLASIAKADETCRLLMTAPGVGPITAIRFLAIIDDPQRFPNAHAVQSYLGLTPGEHSSSERQQRTGITKAGSSAMRRTLVQAAWVAYRRNPADPMITWASKIAERRGIFVAIVALARKIAGVLFAMWRDQAAYRIRERATT